MAFPGNADAWICGMSTHDSEQVKTSVTGLVVQFADAPERRGWLPGDSHARRAQAGNQPIWRQPVENRRPNLAPNFPDPRVI